MWNLPTIGDWLVYVPVGWLAAILAGRVVGYLRIRKEWLVGYTRKVFHFWIFTLAALVGWIGGFGAVQSFGAAVATVVLWAVIQGKQSRLFQALARPKDAPDEKFYVLMPLLMTALGGLSANWLFGDMAVIGYAVAGWGDAVGEPVGTRWGRHRYRIPSFQGAHFERSLEGSLAVLVASWLATVLVLSLTQDLSLLRAGAIALMVAAVSVLVEAFSFHSLDNLTVQLAATATAAGFLA